MKSLFRLIGLVVQLLELILDKVRQIKLIKASHDSEKNKDQRPLEDIDGTGGRATDTKYKRMFTRKAKKRK